MLSKQRLPDLIVISVLLLILLAMNYFKVTSIIGDYPFVALLIMYFVGRAVTWYIISKHTDREE